jgi:hypothetical protein
VLDELSINSPNQVWAADVTYVLMVSGFGYLVDIMVGSAPDCLLGRN